MEEIKNPEVPASLYDRRMNVYREIVKKVCNDVPGDEFRNVKMRSACTFQDIPCDRFSVRFPARVTMRHLDDQGRTVQSVQVLGMVGVRQDFRNSGDWTIEMARPLAENNVTHAIRKDRSDELLKMAGQVLAEGHAEIVIYKDEFVRFNRVVSFDLIPAEELAKLADLNIGTSYRW